jgi:tetratricopeptide (TPR) repeat protein
MTRASVQPVIDGLIRDRIIVEDFRPLSQSLDWRLGQIYFSKYGQTAFSSGDVPFAVHNDGRLSALAAEMLFTSVLEAERSGGIGRSIVVLEIGVGSGLFACFFLDRFQQLCRESGKDYYDRLCYVASDKHHRMLDDLSTSGLLDAHRGRYRLVTFDASQTGAELSALVGGGERPPTLRGVFLNYLLDCLPFSVLRIEGPDARELWSRAYLARGVNPEEYGRLTTDDILAYAASDDVALDTLVDLYPLLAFEFEYRRCDSSTVPHLEVARQLVTMQAPYVLHSYGAIALLSRLLPLLGAGGFVLISDYGPLDAAHKSIGEPYQHFSGSTAVGVNCSELQEVFSGRPDAEWVEPGDDGDSNRFRLLGTRLSPVTTEQFRRFYSRASVEAREERLIRARIHIKEGRMEAALASYRDALAKEPGNWVILTEVANFLLHNFGQPTHALEIAEAALAINRHHPDVWNVWGDCLFALGRYEEAHRAFEEALKLHPASVRARFNLVHTYSQRGDFASALRMVADGLSIDRKGDFRERLLQRQSELLNRISRLEQQRQRMLADRFAGWS